MVVIVFFGCYGGIEISIDGLIDGILKDLGNVSRIWREDDVGEVKGGSISFGDDDICFRK